MIFDFYLRKYELRSSQKIISFCMKKSLFCIENIQLSAFKRKTEISNHNQSLCNDKRLDNMRYP